MRARAAAAAGAVDAEQHGRAGDPAAVEQIADGRERRHAVDALLAADVDGELGRLAELLGQLHRADLAGEQPRALERDQAAALDLQDQLEHRLDPLAAVDGDRDDRQVLGQRQQPVGVQVVQAAEAFGASQQDAGLQPVAAVDVEQLVGEQPVVGAVALAEIGRELQAVLVHSVRSDRAAEWRRADADDEADDDVDDRARDSPSSASRWVSSIQVENVV